MTRLQDVMSRFLRDKIHECHERSIDYEDRDEGTTKNWEAGLLKEKQVGRSIERTDATWLRLWWKLSRSTTRKSEIG